jgi:hypothetical protein
MSQITERQKSDKYNQLVIIVNGALDQAEQVARKHVPEMWNELMAAGFNKEDAREEMVKDIGGRWGEWSIIKFLPKEAKHQGHRLGGLVSAEGRKKRKLEQARQEGGIILEEKMIEQIILLYVKGKKRMKVENGEVKALD